MRGARILIIGAGADWFAATLGGSAAGTSGANTP
jgi:hypothetical protein